MTSISRVARQFTAAVAMALFAAIVFASPVSAAEPKSEFSIAGEFIKFENNVDGESSAWTFTGKALFPWTKGGKIVGGPAVSIGQDDDLNRLGLAIDWNLFGQGPVTVYVGVSGLYFVKDPDDPEVERHTVAGRGGLKIALGPGAAIDLFMTDVVDGRGKDSTDLSGGVGLIARF